MLTLHERNSPLAKPLLLMLTVQSYVSNHNFAGEVNCKGMLSSASTLLSMLCRQRCVVFVFVIDGCHKCRFPRCVCFSLLFFLSFYLSKCCSGKRLHIRFSSGEPKIQFPSTTPLMHTLQLSHTKIYILAQHSAQ